MTFTEQKDDAFSKPAWKDNENGEKAVIASTLTSIYDEMRTRQREAILQQNCMRSDPFFAPNPARLDDDRRCLAISCVMDDENLSSSKDCIWTDAYHRLQDRLKELSTFSMNPSERTTKHITFNQTVDLNGTTYGQLHWTVMQLVGFPNYDAEIHENCVYESSDYMDCVQDALIVGGMDTAIKIHYIGCIAVSSGLLMIGVPESVNANAARDCVRDKLEERGFPLKEPFVNDIVHSTLFRVTNKTEDHDDQLHLKILEIAKEFEQVHLGTVTLRNFRIGPASWRMLPSELDATPAWRKWTLPDESTQRQYQNSVIDAPESRSCFTISGASGANLAKEIRETLLASNSTNTNDNETSHTDDNDEVHPKFAITSGNNISCFNKNSTITEERTDENSTLTSLKILDYMNCQHLSVNGYVGPISLQKKLINQSLDVSHAHIEPNENFNKHASTISGVSGLALAQELQKQLEIEKRSLLQSYNRDFY